MKNATPLIQNKNLKTAENLEKLYAQYLVPMSLTAWANVTTLEQPSLMENVPAKTTSSSMD